MEILSKVVRQAKEDAWREFWIDIATAVSVIVVALLFLALTGCTPY